MKVHSVFRYLFLTVTLLGFSGIRADVVPNWIEEFNNLEISGFQEGVEGTTNELISFLRYQVRDQAKKEKVTAVSFLVFLDRDEKKYQFKYEKKKVKELLSEIADSLSLDIYLTTSGILVVEKGQIISSRLKKKSDIVYTKWLANRTPRS